MIGASQYGIGNLATMGLALAALFFTGPSPARADSPDPDQALALINQYRADNGLPALERVAKLDQAAQRLVDDEAANDFQSHTGSDGSIPQQRMNDAGYRATGYSEIIYGGSPEATDAVDWWQHSPGHNAILLDGRLTQCGIAVASNPDTATGTYWCIDFGNRPAGEPVTPDQDALFAMLNDYRAANGLPALFRDSALDQAARRHADDMAANDFLSGAGSDGSNALQRLQDAGYPAAGYAELLFGGSPAAVDVATAWQNDPSLSALLLSPDLPQCGIAVASRPDTPIGAYWCLELARQ